MDRSKTVEIGDLVKDRVTGFTGIVTAYTKFLSGCDRVGVQPRDLKEGGIRMSEAFDILQLEILEKGAVIVEPKIVEIAPEEGDIRRRRRQARVETGGPPVYATPEPRGAVPR